MNQLDENSALISWKGNEENVFVLYSDKQVKIVSGYAVVWAPEGNLYFRFLVNGYDIVSNHYPVIIRNGRLFNFIYVEPIPDAFSQIKLLTVKEIEIIDHEVFGSALESDESASLSWKISGIKILALLKMNLERRRFKSILKKVRLIQKKIREFLKWRRIRITRKNIPIIRFAKLKVSLFNSKKILPHIVEKFEHFRLKRSKMSRYFIKNKVL